jgi:hypothetical protein
VPDGGAKPACQGGEGTRFGEFDVVERQLGEPGPPVPDPDNYFRKNQAGIKGGRLGEGKGPKGDRAGTGELKGIRDVGLDDEMAPPDVGLEKAIGPGSGESREFAKAHQSVLAAGPAQDVVPDQK